jgi:muconolactone delta-isomerase
MVEGVNAMSLRRFALLTLVLVTAGMLPVPRGSAAPLEPTQDQPVAEQAAPKVRVVHHRPGSASKFGDPVAYAAALEAGQPPHVARGPKAVPHAALMASGVITDPMRGAYLVAPSEQLIRFQHGSGSSVRRQPIDTTPNLAFEPKSSEGAQGLRSGHLASVAADLDGTAIDVLVTAFDSVPNCLQLGAYPSSSQFSFSYYGVTTPCEAYDHSGFVRVAAGYLYDGSTGGEQVVMGWMNGSQLCLRVYDGASLTPKGRTCLASDVERGESFDLAVGDFNGDGSEELAVVWVERGDWRTLTLYRVDDNGNFVATLTSPYRFSQDPFRWIEVRAADLNADGVDEIIVQVTHISAYIQIFTVSADLATVSGPPGKNYGTGGRLAVGRFLAQAGQGIPTGFQAALMYFGTGYNAVELTFALFNMDPQGAPQLIKQSNHDTLLSDATYSSLVAGTFNLDDDDPQRLKSQLAFLVTSNVDATFNPSPDSFPQATVMGIVTFDDQGNGHFPQKPVWNFDYSYQQLVIGDFLGRSVRLGPPTYHFEPDIVQVQAVIYEPPQHIDVFPAPTLTLTVNFNNTPNVKSIFSTFVQYNNQTTKTSKQTLTIGNSFQLSNELDSTIGNKKVGNYVEFSVKAYGGADFEKSTSEYKKQQFGENLEADTDSVFVATSIDYDIWEYPVIRNNAVTGHLVVIRPRKNPLDNGKPCLVNCTVSGGIPTNYPGRAFTIARPDHEPGNLLSWLVGVNASDVLTPIYNSNFQSNQGPTEWYMSWEDINTVTNSTKWWAGVDITITGSQSQPPVFGIAQVKDTFQASYRHDSNRTTEIGFDQSTGLRFYYNNPQVANSDFQVASLVYWAQPFPFMRVNWLLKVPTDPTTIWGQYYGTLPDPTMILRFRSRYFNQVEPRSRYLENFTEDVRFGPTAAVVGQTVAITGTVRNYSFAPVSRQLPIVFYRGNPSEGGVPIASTSLPGLGALSTADVHVQWKPTDGLEGCQAIWMVIDPERTISEVHTDNNRGYGMLPVFSTGQPKQDNPCTNSPGNLPSGQATTMYRPIGVTGAAELRFQHGDLGIQPSSSPTRTLVATVRAENAHFANVHVDFFDGHPKRGSKFIGAEVIPLVWAGQSATARVTWSTERLYGRHDVYARIRHFSPEHGEFENNLVALRVDLPPWPFGAYLPAAPVGRPITGQAILPARPTSTTRRRFRPRS